MKFIAERQGEDAAWNTHTFFNAVPQRQSFNAGIWQDLEYLTGAWAQHFGRVWVVTGPIFADREAYAHLGDTGEFPIAIPEVLFKIVIREGTTPTRPEVLAFLYPQVGPGYTFRPYNHTRFLTTVDEIENLTGIDFLMSLPDQVEAQVEREQASALWATSPSDFIRAARAAAIEQTTGFGVDRVFAELTTAVNLTAMAANKAGREGGDEPHAQYEPHYLHC